MAVARGEAGFWHLKAILVLGRPGTGWNQKTIQKKSSRSNSVVIAKNPKGQVAEASRLARRSLGVRAV